MSVAMELLFISIHPVLKGYVKICLIFYYKVTFIFWLLNLVDIEHVLGIYLCGPVSGN